MKKWMSSLLVVFLFVSLAACGKTDLAEKVREKRPEEFLETDSGTDSETDSETDAVMDADVETAVATADAAANYETQILFIQTDQRRGKLYPRLSYVLFLCFSCCFSCASSCSFSFFFRKHSSSTS